MEIETEARQFIEDLGNKRIAPDINRAFEIALGLRNERRFAALLKFTNDCAALNLNHPKLARYNAHALIERGKLGKAMSVLAALIERTKDDPAEHSQALGMMGRAHKQVFLNDQAELDDWHVRGALQTALKYYLQGFHAAEGKPDFVWHGVNVAALAKRARIAGIPLAEPVDWAAIAHRVENEILERDRNKTISAWDCVNAGEACLALEAPERATEWFVRYVNDSNPGEYALHSTVRQLQSLWSIKPDKTAVGKIFAMLQARLYGVEKGEINIDDIDLHALPSAEDQSRVDLERVIGVGGFAIYKSFVKGLTRGAAVARIGSREQPGVGTGFLVNGGDFNPKWEGQRLLLTNAHVVTNDRSVPGQQDALSPEEAIAIFTQGAPDVDHRVELVWTSPVTQFDATLLRLSPSPCETLGSCAVAPVLPKRPWARDSAPVLYILGHPKGGPLSISLHNNTMIDHEYVETDLASLDPVRIHYRTPTEGGSSGSPVFHGDDWLVIGLHHAYSKRFTPFWGEGAPYEANEAIWVRSIIRATQML